MSPRTLMLGGIAVPVLFVPVFLSTMAGLLQRIAVVAGIQWFVVTASYELRSAPGRRAAPAAVGA